MILYQEVENTFIERYNYQIDTTTMKNTSNKISIFVLLIIIFFAGYFIHPVVEKQKYDCNTLAVDYLEYTKSKYKADERENVWQTVVDTETIIHNLCNLNPEKGEDLEKYLETLSQTK